MIGMAGNHKGAKLSDEVRCDDFHRLIHRSEEKLSTNNLENEGKNQSKPKVDST